MSGCQRRNSRLNQTLNYLWQSVIFHETQDWIGVSGSAGFPGNMNSTTMQPSFSVVDGPVLSSRNPEIRCGKEVTSKVRNTNVQVIRSKSVGVAPLCTHTLQQMG
uniref:Uncharacterized protein n=1 Tax=Eutreptiella gymnastica TaxID=73025 RepID=A0A7S1IQE1_9EUGL|mmetsp:Transcript_35608/g.63634  ORF Transcript_35608/g.63634 Transcript_35608/m.63634 type:complete len:105 (+) Transcript_35608:265-579(+)